MTFTKETMTIPNSLYGDKQVPAYVLAGVAVAKNGKAWGVYHFASGIAIYEKLQRPTLAEAKAVAEQVAALDVDWHRPGDCAEFKKQFALAPTAIRAIAAGGA